MGTRDCLTWGEVKTLAAVGVEFGAHTVSHVQLYDLVSARREKDKRMLSSVIKKESFAVPSKKRTDGGPTPIEYELLASKAKIENTLGKSVSYYSYAYAFPEQDRAFVGMYETALRQAGYRAAVSTRVGTARHGDNPYTLRRIPVNSYDDPLLFRAKLAGAYDWLARPQLLSKLLRAGRAC